MDALDGVGVIIPPLPAPVVAFSGQVCAGCHRALDGRSTVLGLTYDDGLGAAVPLVLCSEACSRGVAPRLGDLVAALRSGGPALGPLTPVPPPDPDGRAS